MPYWKTGLWLCSALVCLSGCSDRERRNPLDPQATRPEGSVVVLQALAGDGQVVLRWDFSRFEDVTGYTLYRRRGDGDFATFGTGVLPAETLELVDRQVENGVLYEYRLALMIEGEGETLLEEVRRATPGAQSAWVADRSSGLVWKISPDNRSAQFFQGRFPGLRGLALNRRDGSGWVSDRFFAGLFRIARDGEVQELAAHLDEPGELSLDPAAGLGWVVDVERSEVYWFSLEQATDSLALKVVDAHFEQPVKLAAQGGMGWIVDRAGGRVLRYNPLLGTRAEWGGLTQPFAVAGGIDGSGWALADEGRVLVRLVSENLFPVLLPFDTALALQVNNSTGDCWVLGPEGVVAFDPMGSPLITWPLEVRGRDLALDAAHGHIWVGSEGGELLLFDFNGRLLARLSGFAAPYRVAVDPGQS